MNILYLATLLLDGSILISCPLKMILASSMLLCHDCFKLPAAFLLSTLHCVSKTYEIFYHNVSCSGLLSCMRLSLQSKMWQPFVIDAPKTSRIFFILKFHKVV